MPTAAQTAANRANSRHSTGPTSATGKVRAAQNARTHGLTAKSFVVLPGQEDAFAELAHSLRAEIGPDGALQELVFETLLHAAWTLHRCRQAEADLYNRSTDPTLDPLINPECARQIRLLDTYTRRAERAFHKAINELRTLQTDAAIRQAFETNEANHTTTAPLADPPKLAQPAQTPPPASPKSATMRKDRAPAFVPPGLGGCSAR